MKNLIIMNFLLMVILGCTNQPINVTEISSITSFDSCDEYCMKDCRENFIDSSAYNQCVRLSKQDVNLIKRVLNNMKRGSWESIQESQIALISDISYEPWIKYSSINRKSTKRMFEWIGENEWIGTYLNSEVLKEGLASLSHLPYDSGVIDGLKKDISQDRKMTLLELAAWEQNETVFEEIHDLILDVCDDSKCIVRVYCSQSSDIVLETVNDLGLTKDVVSGIRFHRGLCS